MDEDRAKIEGDRIQIEEDTSRLRKYVIHNELFWGSSLETSFLLGRDVFTTRSPRKATISKRNRLQKATEDVPTDANSSGHQNVSDWHCLRQSSPQIDCFFTIRIRRHSHTKVLLCGWPLRMDCFLGARSCPLIVRVC